MDLKVDAILLAAGESKRMGPANKLFLEVKGKPMIEHTLTALNHAALREVIVVTSLVNIQLLSEEIIRNYRIILNPDYQQGMTTSIQKGVDASGSGANGYMICMSDQPFMRTEEYNLLLQHFAEAYQKDPACIVVPFFQKQKGNPVIFSAQYRAAILAHAEMEGCKAIVQENRNHVVKIDMPSDSILHDIDTPEDYGKLDY